MLCVKIHLSEECMVLNERAFCTTVKENIKKICGFKDEECIVIIYKTPIYLRCGVNYEEEFVLFELCLSKRLTKEQNIELTTNIKEIAEKYTGIDEKNINFYIIKYEN